MNRYITSGVERTLTPELQLTLWLLYDGVDPSKKDYLHVFTLAKADAFQWIVHQQEQPEYRKELVVISGAEPVIEKVDIIRDDDIAETMPIATVAGNVCFIGISMIIPIFAKAAMRSGTLPAANVMALSIMKNRNPLTATTIVRPAIISGIRFNNYGIELLGINQS